MASPTVSCDSCDSWARTHRNRRARHGDRPCKRNLPHHLPGTAERVHRPRRRSHAGRLTGRGVDSGVGEGLRLQIFHQLLRFGVGGIGDHEGVRRQRHPLRLELGPHVARHRGIELGHRLVTGDDVQPEVVDPVSGLQYGGLRVGVVARTAAPGGDHRHAHADCSDPGHRRSVVLRPAGFDWSVTSAVAGPVRE